MLQAAKPLITYNKEHKSSELFVQATGRRNKSKKRRWLIISVRYRTKCMAYVSQKKNGSVIDLVNVPVVYDFLNFVI